MRSKHVHVLKAAELFTVAILLVGLMCHIPQKETIWIRLSLFMKIAQGMDRQFPAAFHKAEADEPGPGRLEGSDRASDDVVCAAVALTAVRPWIATGIVARPIEKRRCGANR